MMTQILNEMLNVSRHNWPKNTQNLKKTKSHAKRFSESVKRSNPRFNFSMGIGYNYT